MDDGQDDLYYEDLNPVANPWITVDRTKPTGSATSYAGMAARAVNVQQPNKGNLHVHLLHPSPPFRNPNSNKWVLQFPKNSRTRTTPGSRPPPMLIVESINRACQGAYSIRAVTCRWSEAGNLVIEFTANSKGDKITTAAATIIDILAKEDASRSTFYQVLPWSKVVYQFVPCYKVNLEAEFGDEMNVEADLWSDKELERAVRDSHPDLDEIKFRLKPSWTAHPDSIQTSGQHTASVSFAFDDADGSLATKIINSRTLMFATDVRADRWKEKVELSQCIRCWTLGKEHTECQIKCRKCGGRHEEKDHKATECRGCKDSGTSLERLAGSDWICLHARCANCGKPHFADDSGCPKRADAKQEALTNKKKPPRPKYRKPVETINQPDGLRQAPLTFDHAAPSKDATLI